MSEEASIQLTNIAICTIYLLQVPHLITNTSGPEHISLPIFRPVSCFLQQLAHSLWCPHWGTPWGESVRAGESAAGRSTGNCRPGAAHRASGTTNSSKVRLNTTNTTRKQQKKRKRQDDDENEPPDRIPKLDPSEFSCPFACPFYLHDPYEWCNCLRSYTLNRIVDVRLHLTRVHLLAPQCPLCGQEFQDDQSGSAEDRCNEHIEQQTCTPLPSPPPARHGLTRDQFEAVRAIAGHRSGRRGADSAKEKWFEMWDIIFPGTPRPLSPYIRDHADIQRINDMNRAIFAGEQWRELTPTAGESSPATRRMYMAIADRFLAIYRRMYPEPNQQAPGAPASTVAATPVTSSMGDSMQQGNGWEFVSAPSQPAPATENPLPSVPPATATAAPGHGQWMLQHTHGHLSSTGPPHNNNDTMARMNQPLSLLEPSGPGFSMNAPIPDFSMDTNIPDFTLQDFEDPLQTPGRSGSPSQVFSTDYELNTSGFWGRLGDSDDEA